MVKTVILYRETYQATIVFSGYHMPRKGTPGSVGLDLPTQEPFTLLPGQRKRIPLSITWDAVVYDPLKTLVADLRPRSGLANKQGISIVNTPATIDQDYRGDWSVNLINHGTETVSFLHGEFICQLLIDLKEKYPEFDKEFGVAREVRGEGGHGSTG
jgi:dUTP pyrophosphatase